MLHVAHCMLHVALPQIDFNQHSPRRATAAAAAFAFQTQTTKKYSPQRSTTTATAAAAATSPAATATSSTAATSAGQSERGRCTSSFRLALASFLIWSQNWFVISDLGAAKKNKKVQQLPGEQRCCRCC